MGIIKPVIWVGLAGTLAAGTALAVMGPGRACAFFHQARSNINAAIDDRIDDPVALRQQLRDLEAQYPGRIAEVQGDLAELTSQISQLERERAVSARVVELADADLGQIKDMIARAESARGDNGYVMVTVRFGDDSLNLEQAYGKANQLNQLRSAYASKAGDIDNNLGILNQQQERLSQLLGQLQNERSDFQAQLWQLDRQVDAIARNERMIDMLEKRQAAFDKYSRYEAVNPDQVQGRITKILAEQEAKLNVLASDTTDRSYVEIAESELRFQTRVGKELLEKAGETPVIEFEPEVIEITPDGEERAAPTSGRPIASRN